jgi:putative SOS response-associated peptidase YedK
MGQRREGGLLRNEAPGTRRAKIHFIDQRARRPKRWLGPEHRWLVPFTSSKYDTIDGNKVPVWFARNKRRPLLAFAGLWMNWTSVRKAKEGEVPADIDSYLTTEPNAEVKRVHPKAMPVVLTTTEEHDIWMRAPWEEEGAAAAASGRARSRPCPSCGLVSRITAMASCPTLPSNLR